MSSSDHRLEVLLVLLPLLALTSCTREDPGSLVLLGTLERESIGLTTPVTEQLVERPVREGDRVKAGTLVAKVDDTRLRAELGIHEAALRRARLQLAELEAGTSHERIAQSEAELEAADAAADNAQAELRRIKKLFEQSLIAKSDYDRVQAQADEAEAHKRRAQKVLEELRRGTRSEALDVAGGQVAEAEAHVREAEARLAQLELRAPVDSIVDELIFEVGERPPAGAVVVILVSDSVPYANVFVPQRAVTRIAQDQPAKVTVDGVEGVLEARFRWVATEANFTPYYSLTDRERDRLVYRAKVEVTDPRARTLRLGVPVQVRVELSQQAEAVAEASGGGK